MAISDSRMQQRYGSYDKFTKDKGKYLPNEFLAVNNGDPRSGTGKGLYFAYSPTDVEQLMTYEAAEHMIDGIAQDIEDKYLEKMQSKLDKQQGVENAGKPLIVGKDGNVIVGEPTKQIEIDDTLTREGHAADAKATGDKVLQFAIKNSASGENIMLTDSAEERVQGVKVFGKTTQVQTKGLQLFDIDSLTSRAEATYEKVADNAVVVTGRNAYSGVSYTLTNPDRFRGKALHASWKTDIAVPRVTVTFQVKTKAGKVVYGTINVLVPDEELEYILVTLFVNNTGTALDFTSIVLYEDVMVSETKDALWEPYSREYVSPSPDFPQQPEVAGSDGSIKGFLESKNIMKDTTFRASQVWNFVDSSEKIDALIAGGLKANETFTVVIDKSYVGELLSAGIMDTNAQNINAPLQSLSSDGMAVIKTRKALFPTGENRLYITMKSGLPAEAVEKFKTMKVVLLRGDWTGKKVEYETCKAQEIVIATENGMLGIPVTKNGNYTDASGQQWLCDYIDPERGKFVKNIETIVLNGTESWTLRGENENGIINFSVPTNKNYRREIGSICSHLIFDNALIADANREGFLVSSNVIYFRFSKSRIADLEQLKAFLSDNNITLVLGLPSPIETDLSPEEIEVYKQLRTYYPITHMFTDSVPSVGMELDYVADTKNYVDNQIKELVNEQLKTNELILERTV